jgi:hypothetical protein
MSSLTTAFSQIYSSTNFTTLKARTNLLPGQPIYVKDNSDLSDGSGQAAWYIFDENSVEAESLPDVVEITSGGRALLFAGSSGGGGVAVASYEENDIDPGPPAQVGELKLFYHTQQESYKVYLGIDPSGSIGMNGWGYFDFWTV